MTKDSTHGAKECRIQKLEALLQRKLPDDYRIYLKTTNGGVPVRRRFQIPNCQGEAIVDVLLGLDVANDIFAWLEELSGDLPDSIIPIGFDPGGNAILLDVSSETVFYWDSARHFENSTDDTNTFPIGKSFSDFIDRLLD